MIRKIVGRDAWITYIGTNDPMIAFLPVNNDDVVTRAVYKFYHCTVTIGEFDRATNKGWAWETHRELLNQIELGNINVA